MERKTNPDIHMICGKCGCATMFRFKLSIDGNNANGMIYPAVVIACDNCSTLTGLDDIIEDKTDWEKLGLSKRQ